jgi:hypothetical protein
MDRDQDNRDLMQEEVEKDHSDQRNDHEDAYTLQYPQKGYDGMDGQVSDQQVISARESFYDNHTDKEPGFPLYQQGHRGVQNVVEFQNKAISHEPIDALHSHSNRHPQLSLLQMNSANKSMPSFYSSRYEEKSTENKSQRYLNRSGLPKITIPDPRHSESDTIASSYQYPSFSDSHTTIIQYPLAPEKAYTIIGSTTGSQEASVTNEPVPPTITPIRNQQGQLDRQHSHCLERREIFTDFHDLQRHIQSVHWHHLRSMSRVMCPYCGWVSSNQEMVIAHVRDYDHASLWCHNKDCLRPLQFYAKQWELQEHVGSTHRGTKWLCMDCGHNATATRTRNAKYNLNQHLQKQHNAVDVFWCAHSDCDDSKYFTQNSLLEDHIPSAHLGSKWLCLRCGYASVKSDTFRSHVGKHGEAEIKLQGLHVRGFSLYKDARQ